MYERYYEYALKTGGHRIGFFVTGAKVLNTLLFSLSLLIIIIIIIQINQYLVKYLLVNHFWL